MKTTKLIVLGLLLASSVTVHAHGSRHGQRHGGDYDRDGDCQVTPDEILAARSSTFDAINVGTPADDVISFEEFQAWMLKKNADQFANLDTDGNQLISLDEFLANKRDSKKPLLTRIFNLANTTTPVVPPETDPSTLPPDGLDATEFAVLGPQTGSIIRRFAQLDSGVNADGVISRDEYVNAPGNHSRDGHH